MTKSLLRYIILQSTSRRIERLKGIFFTFKSSWQWREAYKYMWRSRKWIYMRDNNGIINKIFILLGKIHLISFFGNGWNFLIGTFKKNPLYLRNYHSLTLLKSVKCLTVFLHKTFMTLSLYIRLFKVRELLLHMLIIII